MKPVAIISLTAAFLTITGCDHDGCVSASEATMWTERGVQAEAEGRIREAWRWYKQIGMAPACGLNQDQRDVANKERGRLMKEFNEAHDVTTRAIERFKNASGRLPTSLLDIAGEIPQSAQRAFKDLSYSVDSNAQTYVLTDRAG